MSASPGEEWGRRLSAPFIDQASYDSFIAASAASRASPIEARRARVAANIMPPLGMLFAVHVEPYDLFMRRHLTYDTSTRHIGVETELLPTPVRAGTVLGGRIRFNWELSLPNLAAVDITGAGGELARERLQLMVDPHSLIERVGFIGINVPPSDFLPPEQIVPTPER